VSSAIVAGAVANKPRNGGETWVRMSWALGLRRLGFDVHFVEALDASRCVDRRGRSTPFAQSLNRAHFEHVTGELDLQDHVTLLGAQGEPLLGLDAARLRELACEADVLFDLSGHLGRQQVAVPVRRRVYVDLDPGFTQAWAADPALDFDIAGYDDYVTVGLNVGTPSCPIPSGGVEWMPTLPPILLDRWACDPSSAASDPPPTAHDPAPATSRPAAPRPARFTTVSTWRSAHGPVEIDGRTHALKHHEFRAVIDLPERLADAETELELALDIDPADAADADALKAHGWRVVSAPALAGTPAAFRDYVRGSCAELSVAHGVYAHTASGWFSDRTGAYLAAGRPALVQDTGLSGLLPLGEGLLTFSSAEQAAQGARAILADLDGHSQAARALAESHLDSDLVLGNLLEGLGLG
jgi:hypothetical protein